MRSLACAGATPVLAIKASSFELPCEGGYVGRNRRSLAGMRTRLKSPIGASLDIRWSWPEIDGDTVGRLLWNSRLSDVKFGNSYPVTCDCAFCLVGRAD